MSRLQDTWSSFSDNIADKYLNGFGHPSIDSKILLADVLKRESGNKRMRLVELGCGNGQLAGFFDERGMTFDYLGVDFSAPLLAAGQHTFKGKSHIRFLNDDVEQLTKVPGKYDYAVYSHVLEMLSSPEASLAAAKRVAEKIVIRFFEPPDQEFSRVELRNLDNGSSDGIPQPYIRWTIGRDFYRLMLSNLGVKQVDVYRSRDRDQVHLLHFD